MYMGKHKFKQILRKEKNPILTDRRILYPIIILNIIGIIINILIIQKTAVSIEEVVEVDMNIALIIIGIALLFEIPAVIIDLLTDVKISKMYKKYKNQEDYNNCCTRIKKPIIIISLILAIFGVVELLDLSYCKYTANKPILSIKVEENERYEKYRTFVFDFYKFNDGRKYIDLVGKKFDDPFKVNTGEKTILLNRTEIKKDKVYIGIPSEFKKASIEHINERYPLLDTEENEVECYQNEDGKINLVISKPNYELKNEDVETFLEALVDLYDYTYGDHITWGDTFMQRTENGKKIGVMEFNINMPEVENGNFYCCMWIYSIDDKCIINSIDIDVIYEKEWKNVAEKIEDTLAFLN